ncbi:VOC family protein [Streptomyces sp. NBC_00557]|uniref:VOC family protein n=1 Tax=Streptomyces sp. NBC_00557 TaxID=2975776 RepID=UPI002E817554|nr:VOC family protein [Streptomyces sp. NBC_00557]WUC37722.1 VOC family protein [Streptomyces sp. NBC_00557]
MTNTSMRLDHVVLWVADPVAAAGFYETAVGLEPIKVAEFAEGKAAFPSVRVNEETILDLAPLGFAPRMKMLPGAAESAGHPVNHICLSLPADAFDALRARLQEHGVTVSYIDRDLSGARGNATRSFYFRDPDGNVFEARHYDG